VVVAFFGAEADDEDQLLQHGLLEWADPFLRRHPVGPGSLDTSVTTTAQGRATLVLAAYWASDDRYHAWASDSGVDAWWADPARLHGRHGVWREILQISRDRFETSYWRDTPRGLGLCPDVALYPTPFCGYYGAMRDRLPAAANDPLDPEHVGPPAGPSDRTGFGERRVVAAPGNVAVIRGGASWALMDPGQREDYEATLRPALHGGMDYLASASVESGCLSLRFLRSVSAEGETLPEEHALGFFRSLADLERWAERHDSHRAIYMGAKARHRRYGEANQLRTWHEVFVLPAQGGRSEYINCHPDTGLMRWLPSRRL
jgi:hypothetical protein